MSGLGVQAVLHPYRGAHFLSFLQLFAYRLWLFVTGQLSVDQLATDEIQIFVLGTIAFSAAIVGSFLVLRRMAMLANSLSHTILLGIVIAFLMTQGAAQTFEGPHFAINFQVMAIASVLTGLMTTFLTEFLHRTVRLAADAANGLVFTSLFALGIVLVTLFTRNVHVGLEVVMGSVDALQLSDLKLSFAILILNSVLTFLFFKEYHLMAFDLGLARSMGFSTALWSYLLMAQVAATVVGSFRAVGVLMVLAFIIGPPLAARFWIRTLKGMIFLAALIGSCASILGVATARHLLTVAHMPLSTGGLVVCYIALLFFLSAVAHLFRYVKRKKKEIEPLF